MQGLPSRCRLKACCLLTAVAGNFTVKFSEAWFFGKGTGVFLESGYRVGAHPARSSRV